MTDQPPPIPRTIHVNNNAQIEIDKESGIDLFLVKVIGLHQDATPSHPLFEQNRLFALKVDFELEQFLSFTDRHRIHFPNMDNSYQRLIVHRLGHLYHLDHVVKTCSMTGSKSVVLYKNNTSQIPPVTLRSAIGWDTVDVRSMQPQYVASYDPGMSASVPGMSVPVPGSLTLLKRTESSSSSTSTSTSSQPSQPVKIMSRPSPQQAIRPLSTLKPSNNNNSKSMQEREAEYLKARAEIFQQDETDQTDQNTQVVEQEQEDTSFNPQARSSFLPPHPSLIRPPKQMPMYAPYQYYDPSYYPNMGYSPMAYTHYNGTIVYPHPSQEYPQEYKETLDNNRQT